MQNLLCWTKTDFHLLFHTPHFVRCACLTACNLFQGILKQVCGSISTVKEIVLNPQSCGTDCYFSLTNTKYISFPTLPYPVLSS